ncbi:50S ribosomal protein L17 [Bifidobacterium callitrichos DSM 23973]|uniref:Large ribosomal subunit protein bL17 n=1 Tax=Bifidobacterium callitrichos DSM 23973 TaxID=1437609 RepID=A0A087A965_9BIFI|nr:50S ribosomal protein L17 [Bifidobacterium callitrichos DSM 23973]
MPTPKQGPRLASSPAHERLMLANMATSLFQNGRIVTTLPKAKRLRPLAERLVTFAKRGDLHSRRRVMRVIRNKSVVHVLFTQIAEQMEQREGGYTRIVKIAPRKGDAAPAAIIELVTEPVSAKQAVVKEAEAATKVAAPAEETPAAELPPSRLRSRRPPPSRPSESFDTERSITRFEDRNPTRGFGPRRIYAYIRHMPSRQSRTLRRAVSW